MTIGDRESHNRSVNVVFGINSSLGKIKKFHKVTAFKIYTLVHIDPTHYFYVSKFDVKNYQYQRNMAKGVESKESNLCLDPGGGGTPIGGSTSTLGRLGCHFGQSQILCH